MSWLDRIDERGARRAANALAAGAMETRDLAQHHLSQFATQARHVAEPRLHEAADYLRHEGAVVARAAAEQAGRASRVAVEQAGRAGHVAVQQAGRASRAVRADPIPAIVGVVGLALLASLLLSRRRT